MKITKTTQLKFNPKDKRVDDVSDTHTARYDVMVGDEKLGLTEIVVSQGTKVTRALETDDGRSWAPHELADALTHMGHVVED